MLRSRFPFGDLVRKSPEAASLKAGSTITLRTWLASADPSDQMAALDAAVSSEDVSLRHPAIAMASQSSNDDLQEAAPAAHMSASSQMGISVTFTNREGKTWTNVQILRIVEANGVRSPVNSRRLA